MLSLNHGGDIYSYEKKYGQKPVDFSSNINPLGAPYSVRRAVVKNIDKISVYPDILCRELKRAVSEKENIDEKYIFCANGAFEALYLLSAAVKPKRAVVTAPAFSGYAEALYNYNTEIVYYNTYEKNNFSIEENIADCIDKNIDIIYLCNPNNPTGGILKDNILEKIISAAALNGCYLLIDESFMDFSENGNIISAKKYLTEYKNLIILKSYTKIYALAGIRAGFIFSSDENLLKKLTLNAPPWNVSALASLCVINAVKDVKFIDKSVAYINKERKKLIAALEKAGFKVFKPEANYIFFKNTRIKNLKLKLEENGILIRLCDDYKGLNENYFRIAVRTRDENIFFIKTLEKL